MPHWSSSVEFRITENTTIWVSFGLRVAKTPAYPVMCQFALFVALCDHNLQPLQTDRRHARCTSVTCNIYGCLAKQLNGSFFFAVQCKYLLTCSYTEQASSVLLMIGFSGLAVAYLAAEYAYRISHCDMQSWARTAAPFLQCLRQHSLLLSVAQ